MTGGAMLAHGDVTPDPSGGEWLRAWPVEPVVWIVLVLVASAYVAAYRRVTVFPPFRLASFVAGLGVIALALASPIGSYDTSLFWVHMNQHLLLTVVAAPLIDLGAPIALAMRAANPSLRHKLSKAMHSLPLRVVAHPLVTWSVFVGVLWGSHFTALYNLSLENEFVHSLEHALFLGSGLLYWWPVIGADPGSNRLPRPARLLYLFVTMPANAFLGLAILSADTVLYQHYATTARSWGPTPLEDQQLAGVIMWVEGGLIFIAAIVGGFYAWLRFEERNTARVDRRIERMLGPH